MTTAPRNFAITPTDDAVGIGSTDLFSLFRNTMRQTTMTELVAAFSMLGVEPPNEEGQTSFSKLSQKAQDAIVCAAMSGYDEPPPKLSEAVRDEIRQWASESGENAEVRHGAKDADLD